MVQVGIGHRDIWWSLDQNNNRQIQTTPIHLEFSFVSRYAPTVYNAKEICDKNFIFLENFAKFKLRNSNLPSTFPHSCESRMTVTTMSQGEEDGSDVLSDDEVISVSETLK